jgi:hypothetical protein
MSSVVIAGNTSGTITLDAPNVAGTTVLTLPTANGTVLTTATPFSNGQGPAFYVYRTADQSGTIFGATKIQFNTELFDTANCFDSTTNYRFTPNVAGYYQINGLAGYVLNSTQIFYLVLYKNGGIYTRGSQIQFNTNGSLSLYSNLVYLNGTTDYIEMYIYNQSGSTQTLAGNGEISYFSGFLARGA